MTGTRLLMVLWWRFVVLTTIRFTVMPVLAGGAWLLGNEHVSASVMRTWRIVAETPPPWAVIGRAPETGGPDDEPGRDRPDAAAPARTGETPRPDGDARRD